jgi:hypothetical protein
MYLWNATRDFDRDPSGIRGLWWYDFPMRDALALSRGGEVRSGRWKTWRKTSARIVEGVCEAVAIFEEDNGCAVEVDTCASAGFEASTDSLEVRDMIVVLGS